MTDGGGPVRRGSATGEIRRKRILDAVVDVVCERGAAGASVEMVLARAKVSSRTFYELFDGLEDCLVAVLYESLEHVSALALRALAAEESWRDGVRYALAAILAFFDAEPALARVCVVEALAGGPFVLEHRERIAGAFRLPVQERIEREVGAVSPLAAEGVLASVLGIVHTHIVTGAPGPLVGLLGPLMGLATAPYLDGWEVQREVELGAQLARAMLAERAVSAPVAGSGGDELLVWSAVHDPRAYRVRLCLLHVAANPGASNRDVANGIGVSHQGQVSSLLARLAGMGLLVKRQGGPGYPNEWSLTAAGELVVAALEQNHSNNPKDSGESMESGGYI
jgi:AcrR family transcriptional regulator